MALLTPIWLLLLVPWAAACIWTGRQGGPRAGVPFLFLWPTGQTASGVRRRLPPAWVMLVLTGTLAMIAAATGPVVLRSPNAVNAAKQPLGNAKIDRFSITPAIPNTPGPAAFAMVRLVNNTNRTRATLRIDDLRQPIDLPPAGQNRDYFVDLPTIGQASTAQLLADNGGAWIDDDAADDHAELTRTTSPARIEPQTPLPDDLARMVAVYSHGRPAAAGAGTVAIARGDAPTGPAVILPKQMGGRSPEAVERIMPIDTSHPITHAASFVGIASAGCSPEHPPGQGWRTLISPTDEPLLNNFPPFLAVREQPARQVWVGFDTGVLAGRADYVIFWTDVFDWLGSGTVEWKPKPTPGASATTTRPSTNAARDPIALSPFLTAVGLVLLTGGLLSGRRR